jgi:hypothetical protein
MVQFSGPQNNGEAQEADSYITSKSLAKEGNKATAAATAEMTSNTVSITVSDRPSRRAAAIAATESFQEAEKAIQRLQKREEEERTKRKSKQSTKTKSTTSKNTTSVQKKNQLTSYIGDGRTLSTGHIVPNRNDTTTKKKSSKEASSVLFQTEEDVTEALLSSVLNQNTSNGKVLSMILRKGMKNAVAKSYESSRANIRLNACLQKQYTMTLSSSDPKTSTSSPLQQYHVGSFDVSYSKGLEGRGTYTDTIEILTKETLEAVIRAVYSNSIKSAAEVEEVETEEEISMLKPIYMSQASPRVFWSLAYHYPEHTSIDESLKALCHDLDWSLIFQDNQQQGANKRARFLSEKAKENLRQLKQKQQRLSGNAKEKNSGHGNAAASAAIEAIAEVEQAMEQTMYPHSNNHTQLERRRAILANAALNRLQQTCILKDNNSDASIKEWNLMTPSEEDVEELVECIQEGSTEQFTSSQQHLLARFLINTCSIHNWRELANSDSNELCTTLRTADDDNIRDLPVTENVLDHWIDYAQIKSIDEIMLEILDGNEDAFIVLRDFIKTGTPKDLALWTYIPDMLLEEIKIVPEGVPFLESVDPSVIVTWCRRAKNALDSYDWLNLYITPID